MEDDAFPIVDNLEYEITKVLNEVPDDWEIIRMHCDTHCVDGQNEVGGNASAAAYLINRKGMEIMMNTKLKGHVDWQQNDILNIYKTKVNLFRTDENKMSTNRIQTSSVISTVFEIVQPITTGEKTWDDKLSYKSVRIPYVNIELNTLNFHTLIFICILCLFLVLKK
jgi:hypothetical protein